MNMDRKTLNTLAQNIRMLMKHYQQSQEALAKKTGISQKTICNMINPGATKKGPAIDNVTAIAKAYGLETWHLLVPNQPIETLLSKSIEKLIDNYTLVSNEGRQNLDRISEREVHYCSIEQKTISKDEGSTIHKHTNSH